MHPVAGSTSLGSAEGARRVSVSARVNPASRHLLPALAFALGVACFHCSPGPSPSDAATPGDAPIVDPSLDLGTGQSAWEPIADGDPVELIHGPQGGYHVFARIREERLGGDIQVTFRVTPAEGGSPINDPSDRIHLIEGRGLIRTAQGWETSTALLVILTQVRAPSDVVGRRLVLEANVAQNGSTAPTTVRRTIVVVDNT